MEAQSLAETIGVAFENSPIGEYKLILYQIGFIL